MPFEPTPPPDDPAVTALLGDPAVWADVPAGLRERTLAAAAASDLGAPRRGRSRPAGRAWRRHAVLAAAAAVLVVGVVAGSRSLQGDPGAGGVEVALSGTVDAPGASATAELRDEPAGVSVLLAVDDLPPAPAGTFYEVWLVGPGGKVSAGSFHQRGSQDSVALWLGVEPDGYDALTVTRQPVAGGTNAPGVVVLRGDLSR
jgi:hypothetical protein